MTSYVINKKELIMTMWLLSAVVAPVKPVSGKKNWFELDGIPKSLGDVDIGGWLSDEIHDSPQGSKIVKNAKLVGVLSIPVQRDR